MAYLISNSTKEQEKYKSKKEGVYPEEGDILYHIERIRKHYNINENLQSFEMVDGNFDRAVFEKHEPLETKFIRTGGSSNIRKEGIWKFENGYVVFFIMGNERFTFAFTNHLELLMDEVGSEVPRLDPGIYQLNSTNRGIIPEKVNVFPEEPLLNDNLQERMTDEIIKFRENESLYTNIGAEYKRGILLYGNPGNGKTTFIKSLLGKFDDIVGIIISPNDIDEILWVQDLINKDNMKTTLKIIILEDLDSMPVNRRTDLLNLIDGAKNVYNTIFLATTNYPDQLDKGFVDRPSRFDTFYMIAEPNEECRRRLIEKYFPNLTYDIIDKAVKKTKNLKGCHFKELYFVCNFYNISLDNAIEELNNKFKAFRNFGEENTYLG